MRTLCLLPALALGACDPKLKLGEVLDADQPAGEEEPADSVGEADSNDPAPEDPDEDESASDGDSGVPGDDDGVPGEDDGVPGDDDGAPGDGCDVWAQDCPAGQKCAATASDGGTSWNTLQCVPIDPTPVPPGGACQVVGDALSGVDNCELGSMCWDTDPVTGIGTCVAQCGGSEEQPECADGTQCLISNGGVLPLCVDECEPLAQDCKATEVCIGVGTGFICANDASGDEGQLYDSCQYLNACDKGLICVSTTLAAECDPAEAGCCLPFCDLTTESTCTGEGQECLPWTETPSPGDENVGLCALPG